MWPGVKNKRLRNEYEESPKKTAFRSFSWEMRQREREMGSCGGRGREQKNRTRIDRKSVCDKMREGDGKSWEKERERTMMQMQTFSNMVEAKTIFHYIGFDAFRHLFCAFLWIPKPVNIVKPVKLLYHTYIHTHTNIPHSNGNKIVLITKWPDTFPCLFRSINVGQFCFKELSSLCIYRS